MPPGGPSTSRVIRCPTTAMAWVPSTTSTSGSMPTAGRRWRRSTGCPAHRSSGPRASSSSGCSRTASPSWWWRRTSRRSPSRPRRSCGRLRLIWPLTTRDSPPLRDPRADPHGADRRQHRPPRHPGHRLPHPRRPRPHPRPGRLVPAAYYIGPILMSLPAGTLADQWGIARTLILGQVVIAVGLVAVSGAPSYGVLIVLMIAAGFGYGMLNPTSTKAVMAWHRLERRAAHAAGPAGGAPLGGGRPPGRAGRVWPWGGPVGAPLLPGAWGGRGVP